MAIHLDRDLCQGHAVCVSEAPELFRLNEGEHVVTLLASEAVADLRKKVALAVKHCPTRALAISEKT
jgi:sterol 14-demethylase